MSEKQTTAKKKPGRKPKADKTAEADNRNGGAVGESGAPDNGSGGSGENTEQAAHAPDQSLCDGKPQPHAAFLTVSFGIDLTEAGKDFLHIFPLDADAGIPYADL